MRAQLYYKFEEIISLENLLIAWQEFVKGKRSKKDVQDFSLNLMDNLASLHDDLSTFAYRHGGYEAFKINDSKPRDIHKASVRDRVLHHALYRLLYSFFDAVFTSDSFSCRIDRGTHKAADQFQIFARRISRNHTKTCWVLKMDIKKFFANIDQNILLGILTTYIPDQNVLWLLKEVIHSFSNSVPDVGLPLGNLTSQLLVNVYMNEFDNYVRHRLRTKHYIRYADDFVLLSSDRNELEQKIEPIKTFLWECLRLQPHPNKISIETVASGVDFLGWVHFPDHRVLRTRTKHRMFNRIREHAVPETFQSYMGMLQHGNAGTLRNELRNNYWLLKKEASEEASL
jgi:RNA-directed DNA polymerase